MKELPCTSCDVGRFGRSGILFVPAENRAHESARPLSRVVRPRSVTHAFCFHEAQSCAWHAVAIGSVDVLPLCPLRWPKKLLTRLRRRRPDSPPIMPTVPPILAWHRLGRCRGLHASCRLNLLTGLRRNSLGRPASMAVVFEHHGHDGLAAFAHEIYGSCRSDIESRFFLAVREAPSRCL